MVDYSVTLKILVLEDEHIIAYDIRDILESMGHHVLLAHNLEDCLYILDTSNPELLLSDINLNTNETGIEIVRKIKEIKPLLEVIYVTAHSDETTFLEAQTTVPINYLVKPYSEEQLKTTVNLAVNYLYLKNENGDDLKKLTHAEFKIVELIAQQKSSKEIALQLHVSEKTVRNHRYNITKKLNLPPENNCLLSWALQQFRN